MQNLNVGKAVISPRLPVVAGAYTTVTFTYTAGHPIDDSGYIKIAFRSVSDFGRPQFEQPQAPNYCTVATTGACRIAPRWDPKGHTRPWGRALWLQVKGGYLDKAQSVTVVFGDAAAGSPGWRIQTFRERTFEFKTLVDPIATYEFKELPKSPTLRVVAGEPARAVCVAPSQLRVNEPFAYHLKLEDRWGNPTCKPKTVRHRGFGEEGVRTIVVRDKATGLVAESNPIDVRERESGVRGYWADFHGQSEETIGTNTIRDYFTFARDYALLDIAAHQGNDFQVTDAFWTTVNRTTRRFYAPGRFVTFPGYEWSGNTPLGGDRNVYFAAEGGRITRSCTDLLPGKRSRYANSPTAAALFRRLRRQRGPEAFAFAHVGGRYADLRMHDEAVELAVEVHSAWGTFEWLVDEAFKRGYRIGICANSDGHKCRPGASYPGAGEFGSYGGLTCVMARELDRAAVMAALKARHVYATTGNRCLLDVILTTADGRQAVMGDVIRVGPDVPRLDVRVVGTAPIETVVVRNGAARIGTERPYEQHELGRRIKIVWSGAEVPGRARMCAWDGELRVRGNEIREVVPVNFWNPDRPIERVSSKRLRWQSSTTGGLAGMILTLARPAAGSVDIATVQCRAKCAIRSIGLVPTVWKCGGLRKQIEAYRLPDRAPCTEFPFCLGLTRLHEGDNPVCIRVTQEDGHMAWSSPIYAVR
ncbi:MAG: DUF3604 domain-containing protein [Kiritimatiellae bacterium]|nr:DUF3604 domain-containing protein [Kiritimatiellia bacterium]